SCHSSGPPLNHESRPRPRVHHSPCWRVPHTGFWFFRWIPPVAVALFPCPLLSHLRRTRILLRHFLLRRKPSIHRPGSPWLCPVLSREMKEHFLPPVSVRE